MNEMRVNDNEISMMNQQSFFLFNAGEISLETA